MGKIKYITVIKAMLWTSGLNPDFFEDTYADQSSINVVRFYEGLQGFFKVGKESWVFFFSDGIFMHKPSATMSFMLKHRDVILENYDYV